MNKMAMVAAAMTGTKRLILTGVSSHQCIETTLTAFRRPVAGA
jgi:nicotinamidase-related amidase